MINRIFLIFFIKCTQLIYTVHGQVQDNFLRYININPFGFHSGGPTTIINHNQNYYIALSLKKIAGGMYGPEPYIAKYDNEGYLYDFIDLKFTNYFNKIISYSTINNIYPVKDNLLILSHVTTFLNGSSIQGWFLSDTNFINNLHFNFNGYPILHNDTSVIGITYDIDIDKCELICISLIYNTPIWTIKVLDILKNNNLGPENYNFLHITKKSNKIFIYLNNKSNLKEKIMIDISFDGLMNVSIINDDFDRIYFFPETNVFIKILDLLKDADYLSQPIFNYKGYLNSTIFICNKSNEILGTVIIGDSLKHQSFYVFDAWADSYNQFTIHYHLSNAKDSVQEAGLLSFDINGRINWCMNYLKEDLKIKYPYFRKSTNNSFYSIMRDRYRDLIMNTDSKGRVFYSDKIFLFTESNCKYILTNIQHHDSDSFMFYPNPASTHINVYFPSNSLLKIIDISGRIIYESYFNQGINKIDLLNIPSGSYLLIAKDQFNSLKTGKLIIIR